MTTVPVRFNNTKVEPFAFMPQTPQHSSQGVNSSIREMRMTIGRQISQIDNDKLFRPYQSGVTMMKKQTSPNVNMSMNNPEASYYARSTLEQ